MNVAIDMLLFCPACDAQHVDAPQPEKNWSNPPHRSHECQHCGHVWRPSDRATNGVASLETHGARDGDPKPTARSALRAALASAGQFIEDDTCRHDHEKAIVLMVARDALSKTEASRAAIAKAVAK